MSLLVGEVFRAVREKGAKQALGALLENPFFFFSLTCGMCASSVHSLTIYRSLFSL
jgi:hypothetical protein